MINCEKEFLPISEKNHSRRCQIPLRKNQFLYLTQEYTPKDGDKYVIFHHPGHFLIYDTLTKHCVYNATHGPLPPVKSLENLSDEEIVTVICEFLVSDEDLDIPENQDEFSLFYDLLAAFRVLDADKSIASHTHADVLNKYFGTTYKRWQPGTWPNEDGKEKNFRVWFPNLAKKEGANYIPATNDCLNILSPDGNEITFDDLQKRGTDINNVYRGFDLIFAKEPNGDYIFRGVFVFDEEKSRLNHSVSKKIAARIKVIGRPASTIEILDGDFETPEQKKQRIKKATEIEDSIKELSLAGEERTALVSVRVNQSEFRERLIKRYGKCCLCGVSDPDLLIASHIKPWAVSTPEERLDTDNGLLLCPNHDKLFDHGFISFDANGKIIISNKISKNDRTFMNVQEDMEISLTRGNQGYMEYHNKNIYKACD